MTRQQRIEKAREADHHEKEDSGIGEDLKEIRELMTDFAASLDTGWTPVAERLPDEDGPYIVTAHWDDEPEDCAFTEELVFYADAQEWQQEQGTLALRRIIAWMPLPNPYKGE